MPGKINEIVVEPEAPTTVNTLSRLSTELATINPNNKMQIVTM